MSRAQIVLGLMIGKLDPEDFTVRPVDEEKSLVDKNGAVLTVGSEELLCVDAQCAHGECVLARRLVFRASNGDKVVFSKTSTEWDYPEMGDVVQALIAEMSENPGGAFPIMGGGTEFLQ